MIKYSQYFVIAIPSLFLINCTKETDTEKILTKNKWQNEYEYSNEIWNFKENGTLDITNRPTHSNLAPYCNPCDEELLWEHKNEKIIITENYWGKDWDSIQGWHDSYITNKYEYDLIELNSNNLEIWRINLDVIESASFKSCD